MRLWDTGDRVVVDTTELGGLAAGQDMGPLAPGIGFIDVSRVGDGTSARLAAALGANPPDLGRLASALTASLDQVDEIEPGTFTGRMSHTAFVEALGQDIEVTARSLAAGLALALDIDVEALTDVYVQAYSSPADFRVTVADGYVTSVRETFDNTVTFDALAASSGMFASDDERTAFEAMFGGMGWTVETLITFTPEPGLEVPVPPATDDDRTEAWLAFLSASGL